jgi:hypothetical protein
MPKPSIRKDRALKAKVEDGLVKRIREELPDLDERPHRPHILYRGGAFLVLYNGGLFPLTEAPLETLKAFEEDIHGSTVTSVSVQLEMNSAEFFQLATVVLPACIQAHKTMEEAEAKAKAALVGKTSVPPD